MRSLSLDISLRIACLCSGMTISNRKREFSFSLTKDRPAIEEKKISWVKNGSHISLFKSKNVGWKGYSGTEIFVSIDHSNVFWHLKNLRFLKMSEYLNGNEQTACSIQFRMNARVARDNLSSLNSCRHVQTSFFSKRCVKLRQDKRVLHETELSKCKLMQRRRSFVLHLFQ